MEFLIVAFVILLIFLIAKKINSRSKSKKKKDIYPLW